MLGTEEEIDELFLEVQKTNNKDALKIFLILKNIENFTYMIKYYGIPEDILIKAIPYFEHFRKKKKEKIYSIGDINDYFYIIVKGSIYIEEKGEMIKGIQQYQEKCILKEGFCFGEFELLYDLNRICNVYAIENCDLLGIRKEKFLKILSKYILKSQNERKNLIINFIPCFRQMSNQKFFLYYNDFILEKIVKQNYIFKEGSEANALFLILQGRSRYVKNGTNLLYLGINDLVGFESIDFEPESNENPIYNCSLIAIDDCYIIKIRIGSLGNFRYRVRKELTTFRDEKNNLFTQLIEQGKKEREKFKISYREDVFKETIKESIKKLPIDKIKQYFYLPGELKENKKKLNTRLLNINIINEEGHYKFNTITKTLTKTNDTKINLKTLTQANNKFEGRTLSNRKFLEKKVYRKNIRTLSDINQDVLQKSIGRRTNVLRNINPKNIKHFTINTGDFDLPLITMYKSHSYKNKLKQEVL